MLDGKPFEDVVYLLRSEGVWVNEIDVDFWVFWFGFFVQHRLQHDAELTQLLEAIPQRLAVR